MRGRAIVPEWQLLGQATPVGNEMMASFTEKLQQLREKKARLSDGGAGSGGKAADDDVESPE